MTPRMVRQFRRWQRCPYVHPFTCRCGAEMRASVTQRPNALHLVCARCGQPQVVSEGSLLWDLLDRFQWHPVRWWLIQQRARWTGRVRRWWRWVRA